MPDPADQATDPTVTTPGDKLREPDLPPDLIDPGEIPPRPKDTDAKKPRSKESKLRSKLAATKSAEIKALKTSLSGILEAPALIIQEPWPKAHVEAQAPNLADAIIRKAEADDEFRRKLNNLLSAGDGAGLFLAFAMYVAPLAIYYGAPAPPPVKAMLKVPDRPPKHQPGPIPFKGPEDDIVREAREHGFDDPHEYQLAVMAAAEAAARKATENDPAAVLPDE